MSDDLLRYPIGKFKPPGKLTSSDIYKFISVIEQLPLKMREAVNGLHTDQLDTPYREGGWTLRQVVHHVADSHMNAYIRFKLALTEDKPDIRPYLEDRWAELTDARYGALEVSLRLLESLHARWTLVVSNLADESWSRTYYHPENKKEWRLDEALALYSWHSEHHLAHITSLRRRMKW